MTFLRIAGTPWFGMVERSQAIACHAVPWGTRNARNSVLPRTQISSWCRRRLKMSQQLFSAAYRIPLPTLKNWEQGRRQPYAPAAYLLAIKQRPKEIMEAVAR
jgi:putative transcriptional regulator